MAKETASATEPKATEYFVTYVPYPACRDAWCGPLSSEGKKMQKSKKDVCFVPSCNEEMDCSKERPYCYWKGNSDKIKCCKQSDEYITYLLHPERGCEEKAPFQCIRDPCTEMIRDSYCGVSIGLLTTAALKDFKELLIGTQEKPFIIKNSGILFLRSSKDIAGFTPTERVKHTKAIRRYEEESRNEEFRGVDYIRALKDCIETAADIQLEHNIPPLTVAGPVSTDSSPHRVAISDNMDQHTVGGKPTTKGEKINTVGRRKEKRTVWIEKQFLDGFTPAQNS